MTNPDTDWSTDRYEEGYLAGQESIIDRLHKVLDREDLRDHTDLDGTGPVHVDQAGYVAIRFGDLRRRCWLEPGDYTMTITRQPPQETPT